MRFREPPYPRLDALQPDWVRGGVDWAEGCSFTCPTHLEPCRLVVLFQNPVGGHDPDPTLPNLPRHFRVGASFSSLTLLGPLDMGEHFRGHLIEGEFWPELVLH